MSLTIESIHIKRFKAIRDSGQIKFQPFTVCIGPNGCGKSSLIEAIETIHDLTFMGLDEAFNSLRGFEHVRNRDVAPRRRITAGGAEGTSQPIELSWKGITEIGQRQYAALTRVNSINGEATLLFEREEVKLTAPAELYIRLESSDLVDGQGNHIAPLSPALSMLDGQLGAEIAQWTFLRMSPDMMTDGQPPMRSGVYSRLEPSGRNVGNYLYELVNYPELGLQAFQIIIDRLRQALPFISDVQVRELREWERSVILQVKHANESIPAWLMSGGTLRLLTLLAVLNHPEMPMLLCVDEIENGLDPFTLDLVIRELRRAVAEDGLQVIVTTHSPYVMALCAPQELLYARRENGQVTFKAFPDEPAAQDWRERFAPGNTMRPEDLEDPPAD